MEIKIDDTDIVLVIPVDDDVRIYIPEAIEYTNYLVAHLASEIKRYLEDEEYRTSIDEKFDNEVSSLEEDKKLN